MKTINLNKTFITKQDILKQYTDLDVYRLYMDEDVSFKGNMSSPLRKDVKPSFGFFMGESNEICFNDFVHGTGDFVKFVMLKFNLSWFEALSKIALDLGIADDYIVKNTFKTNVKTNSFSTSREELIKEHNAKTLGKTSREWTLKDLSFWNQYGITKNTLDLYRVCPVSYLHVGINKTIIPADPLAYSYTELKDGKETFKIYQPENEFYKWLNNHDEAVWQGWEQLPKSGEQLIITKSLKDVMSIRDVVGIPAVSLQTESAIPKEHVLEQLKSRFDTVYILYDNDFDKPVNWGRQFGQKIAEHFSLWQIEIGEELHVKDFSDLVKVHGEKIAREYLLELLKVPF